MIYPPKWLAFCGVSTLHGRLLIALALTWVLILALVLSTAWFTGQAMVKDTRLAVLDQQAQTLGDELTEKMFSRIAALERVAATLPVQALEGSPAKVALKRLLAPQQALLEWFDGLVVADASGTVLADLPQVGGREGLDISEVEYFRMIAHSGHAYVSKPLVGRATEVPLVVVGVPIKNEDGAFKGVLGGVVSLRTSQLFTRLALLDAGRLGAVSIMTVSGRYLYHSDRDLVLEDVDPNAQNRVLQKALDGWQGTAVGPLPGGSLGLQAYAQVWPSHWVVSYTLDMREAYGPLARYVGKLWGAWGLLAVLMLPMLWLLLGKMLRPLRQLESQIGEVGLGQRSQVDLTTGMAELNDVAVTFNRVENERQGLLNNLQEREAFLDSILKGTPQGMFVANFEGKISYMNPALLELLGVQSSLSTSAWLERVHPDDRDGTVDMWRHSLKSHQDFIRQLRFQRDDGEMLWLEVHARVVMTSRHALSIGMIGMVKDITERREQEALQRWEAEHDPLTGLLNRRGFERRLEEAFADFSKTSTPSALILFDLDHFKPINDEGGHALGDEMLRRIAQVVAWDVRRSDHVARQGGDEFGVLLPSCTLHQAIKIAESLRSAIASISVEQQAQHYQVTTSIGITAFSNDDQSIHDVLKRADAASYQAKGQGRNLLVVYRLDEGDQDDLFH